MATDQEKADKAFLKELDKKLAEVAVMRDETYWEAEHPDHCFDDWQYEVSEGNTRMGYWEWVASEVTSHADDEPEAEEEQ